MMMRFLLPIFLVVAASASVLDHATQFQTFKSKHGKTYTNQVEETKRFNIFKTNLENIAAHNARYEQGLVTYTLGANQFADMTPQEFSARLTLQISAKPKLNINKTFKIPEGVKAPASIDWRTNAVTPVKTQGYCLSCWAFALTGATEGAYAIKTGKLISLSEQQLVDCTRPTNEGCQGGYLDSTLPYIASDGLQSETSYPYEGLDKKCRYDASKVVTRIDDFDAIYYNETGIQTVVGTIGPVAIAINGKNTQFYQSGIFHDASCKDEPVNHGVLVVGYGTEGGEDYWIVKNSWSDAWGENGYIRFKRGVNECSLTTDAVYPILH